MADNPRPPDAELDEAVEQYLSIRPDLVRAWDDGYLWSGGWGGEDHSIEKARGLIRFWATHLTDADRRLLADKVRDGR